MQINTENLYKELAEKHGVSEAEARKVIYETFGFVRKTITEEPEKAIRLKRFGIFLPKSKNKKR